MTRGAILVIDEINATTPDCLFILHGLLDEDRRITLPNGEVIRPDKNFRVFATCNPDYEGTKSLNKAFIDRFPIILSVDTLPPKKEIKLLTDKTGITEELAQKLVTVATLGRKDYTENKISTFISTRGLLNMAFLIKSGLEPKEAYLKAITRKSQNKEEQKLLNDFFLAVFKLSGTLEDNPDQAMVVTKWDLDIQKDAIERYQKIAEEAEKDKQKDGLALEKAEEELKRLKGIENQNKDLSDQVAKLTKQVETYTKLEDIIKSASKSYVKSH
jgi:midasin (ATPase involved in ribosome maturation)